MTGSDDPIPGPIYLDASAWVKLYVPERGSDVLNRALLGRRDLLVSDLGATEVASAFGRACREGRMDRLSARRTLRTLRRHVEVGMLQRVELTPVVYLDAERLLLAEHGVPLRAADALHLALATRHGVATMATYDPRLAAVAQAVALGVFAPGEA